MTDCVFCRIAAKEIPAKIVYEDPHALAFLDIHPLMKGHTLVIPRAHRARVEDLSVDEARGFFSAVHKLSRRVPKAVHAPASTLAINDGPEAGQEVQHLHLHLVPRFKGDGAGGIHAMAWARPAVATDEMDRIAKEIRLLP